MYVFSALLEVMGGVVIFAYPLYTLSSLTTVPPAYSMTPGTGHSLYVNIGNPKLHVAFGCACTKVEAWKWIHPGLHLNCDCRTHELSDLRKVGESLRGYEVLDV